MAIKNLGRVVGLSAYETWLAQGNDGTEEAFLTSLKGATGPEGPQGPKGDTGDTGPAGKDGVDGKTPIKGTDYFTEADKQELVSLVLAEIPNAEGIDY